MAVFNAELKERFLEVLEETCSVQDAAQAVGVARRTAYYQRSVDLEFAKRWDDSLNQALDDLLGEAHKRATVGKSDRLLEVMLKFRYGDRLADRLNVQVEGSIGLRPEVLLSMNDAYRVQLADLLEQYQRAERALTLEHGDGCART